MSTTFPSQVRFRAMIRSDLPAVLAIEKRSFRQPWEKEQFLEAMSGKGGARAYVLEENARLIGYYILELQGRNAHLLNLAIHPEYRRRGHASRTLRQVEQLCRGGIESSRADEGKGEPGEGEPVTFDLSGAAGQGELAGIQEQGALLGEIYLEVEETNLPAQFLYKKMGYRATKVLRNYYPALHEDGYKMVRKLYATPLGTASI